MLHQLLTSLIPVDFSTRSVTVLLQQKLVLLSLMNLQKLTLELGFERHDYKVSGRVGTSNIGSFLTK